ncbi:MAG: class I SAM-dependent methyltransferase [Leptospirales bacterium]|jgi:ubiquinone/menaquinone biosynthesis C-methylase UbiE
MNQSVKFWDRIAKFYSKQAIANVPAYEKKLEVTRGYLRPDSTVLEFGCGTGSTAIVHAPFVKHVRATDVSAKMLEIAREKAKAQGVGNIVFEQQSIDELQVADASIDAVLGLSILHLLEDRDAAIAKVHRMLKPGGVFVSNTVCMGDGMKWFRRVAPLGAFLGLLPLVKFFGPADLERSLKDAGFQIDYNWQPPGGRSVFIVAKKAAR